MIRQQGLVLKLERLAALISAQDSVSPVTGEKALTSVVAHKKAVMEAGWIPGCQSLKRPIFHP
ncbi:MAG: hypothetical protein LJE70_02375 [Chromatiaceae bacterium]|nr:hypothetical protein [Chromatiaceae bacterium]